MDPMVRRSAVLAASLLACALVGGCAGTVRSSGPLALPARVPVRVFPIILVASSEGLVELALRGALAGHLAADGRARVEEVPFGSLEPRRLAGAIPAPSVVVAIGATERRSVRQDWGSRPMTVCGPMGCYTQMQTYAFDVPVLEAEVTVTVHDGPSAAVLQRETLTARDEGRDDARMQERIIAELSVQLLALVDVSVRDVEVTLYEVGVPGVPEAIEAIEGGDWARGRALLEEAAVSPERAELGARDAARLLYDLAMGRRFDPTTLADPARHFDEAETALRAALRTDPRPEYERALEELAAHRQAYAEVVRQEQAAAHNFGLVGAAATAPTAVTHAN